MALDNFIPRNAVELCNECRRRVDYTATCEVYPNRIPKKVLFSNDCPDFEPKEAEKAAQHKKRQKEEE